MDHVCCNKYSIFIVYTVVLLSLIRTSNGGQTRHEDDQEISNMMQEQEQQQHRLSKRAVRLCGVKLVNTMKMICNHCYQPPKTKNPKKRSVNFTDNDERRHFMTTISSLQDDQKSSIDYINTYIEKRFGNAVPTPLGTNSVGIANKCCLNQCGWNDLKSYCCKNPPKTTMEPTIFWCCRKVSHCLQKLLFTACGVL